MGFSAQFQPGIDPAIGTIQNKYKPRLKRPLLIEARLAAICRFLFQRFTAEILTPET